MELGPKLAEGKTKIIYAHPADPGLAIILHKDSISAGDGARRNLIEGKGALSGRTTANVFALLSRAGIQTHYVEAPEPTTMVIRRCTMLPLEVVMRRAATGSFLKRHPEVTEGARFDPVLVEFFLKDDARHDPQVTPEEITGMGLATVAEIEQMLEQGRRVFAVLEEAWAAQDVMLVDLKIEFGRLAGGAVSGEASALVVADVIDNDSWRIWPGGDKGQMLDKQVYRNMQQVTDEGLEDIRRRYEAVAGLTDRWQNS